MLDTLHAPRTEVSEPDAVLGIGPQRRSPDPAAARLRAATRYYERHVIAWHALGRLSEARAARDAIARHRRKLAAEPAETSNAPIRWLTTGIVRPRSPTSRATKLDT
jgi:hypothetical protein